MKKRGKNKVLILVLIIAIIIVLLFGLYFLLKPTFTGKVVETQETSAFSLEGSVLQNQVENPSIQKSRIDLSINRQIYGFSINGDVHLNSDNSLVRVILVDNKDKEYLVYEEYPLISDNKAEIKNHCEETCALNGVVPSYLKIQNINASVKINSFNYIDSSENLETGNWIKKTLKLFIREDKSKRIINIDKEKKANQESKKIEKIKAGIKEKNQKWTAGETSVSNMSYEDKKNLFLKSDGTPVDELPNLQGLEYYTGGVFEFSNENVQESTSQSNVKTPIITGSAITGAVIESGYGILSITSNIAGASLYLDGSNTFWTTRANGSINYSAQAGNHVVKIIKPGYYPYYANVSVKEGQTITISAILIAGEAGLVINSAPPGFYVVTTDEEFIDDNIIYTGTPSYAIGSTPITMSMTPGNHSFIIQKVVGEPYSYNVTINSVKGQTTIINVPYSSKYPLSWDWRNRNGENWMTSVKNQGILPACDLYATIGELEAGTNLYFNQHLDLDLSEMDLTSCINRSRLSAVNEFCFSTHDNTLTCGCVLNPQTCPKPDCTTVMAGNMEAINSGLVKDYLIRNGPVYATYLGFGQSHAMVLVGWVTASDSDTIWIFKNSWGGSWGESGYYRVKGEGFGNGKIIYYPITITSNPNLQISCVDKDNDGYCNWGISENKPSTCPASCNLERDCDDSNPNIGPFVSYNGAVKNYSCVGQSIVPSTGNLSVTSNPTGATVYLDGLNKGISPITIASLATGSHSLVLSKTGYNNYTTSVSINANQLTTISATLTPITTPVTTGNLSVSSSPTGATVYLDGISKGVSPLTISGISAGSHSLVLSKTGYNNYTTSVSINANQLTTISATLTPVTPPQSGQSFSDNFDRADSLDLGSSWNIISGGFAVSNNNAVNALTKSIHIAIIPSFSSAKQIVSADFASVDNNGAPKFGLILRYQDPSNYYLMYRQTGGSSMIIISKIVNGIETKLKTGSLGNPAKNVFFKIKGEADDGTLKLSIDNGSPITITDNTFSSGSAGIWVNTLGGAYSHKVDNFSSVGEGSVTPINGNLSVTSNPIGATVYLDRLNKGISPITIANLATGSHSLVLSKTGYNNYTTSVSINANQLTTISATLTPITTPVTTGNLSVSSSPTGASVYLDNINQGITPIVINNVSEGNHSLKLTMNDYNDYNTNVNIIVGQLTSINAILTPIPVQTTGDLSITSSPSGASVYLDDVYKGISPLTLTEISEGNHSLKLTMNDYNDYNTNVNIIVGQLTTVSAILNPVTPPQSGQSFSDNFDRADSLDLGSSWNIISGGFAVSNNNAVNALTKSIHIAIAPSFNSAKQIVSADFTSVDNNLGPKFGLILRYQDPSNYYLMYRQTGGSSMIIISKIVNGIETKLKTGSLGNPAKNVFFKIKGEADDGTLKLSIDNGSPITITDNTFSSGSAGIWVNTLGGAYSHKVDNFIASDSSTQTMPSSKFSLKNIIDWLRNLF